MLTGYHFTAYHNWSSIQRDGLKPRYIEEETLRSLAWKRGITREGSWVFCEPPSDDQDFLGQLLYQMINHRTPEVALVRCLYKKRESLAALVRALGDVPVFEHDGFLAMQRGNGDEEVWDYHKNKPYDIVLANIPPNRLSLIAVYCIQEIGNGD
jgi:hypothetical protein